MCVTLIGGMDRLKQDYIAAARQGGAPLNSISRTAPMFVDNIGNPEAIIEFTNKVSHEAKRKALLHARSRNIPIHLVHSCGVSSLRDCLSS